LRLRSHFDQVQLSLCGELSGLFDGDDSQLLPGGVIEKTDGRNADLVVDPQLSECDGRNLRI
jgi:hypothetical protein